MKNKKIWVGLIGGFAALVVGFGYFAYANPLFFPTSKASSTGTSTATYATPGTGTTTVVFDAYQLNQDSSVVVNSAPYRLSVLAFLTATTGQPTLSIACEYSTDNIDYYKGDCAANVSTTTSPVNLANMVEYQLLFASSTCASSGAAYANQSTCARVFPVQTFTRYTKVFGYLSSTTQASTRNDDGNIRIEIIPQREESR